MREDDIDVVVKGGGMFEIDAVEIARIIAKVCPASPRQAAKAANLIVDYLAFTITRQQQKPDA